MSQPYDWQNYPKARSEASEQGDPAGGMVAVGPDASTEAVRANGNAAGEAAASDSDAEQAGAGQAGAEQAGGEQAGGEQAGAEQAGGGVQAGAQRDGDGAPSEDGGQAEGELAEDEPAEGEPADADVDLDEADEGGAGRDQGRSGWSGRAIGPLSGLLPGGAVDLDADEMPGAPPAPQAAAGPAKPANGESATAAPGEHEPAVASAAGELLVDEVSPTAQHDRTAEETQPHEEDLTATDDRWHAVLVGFVDDPRGSVEAARTLIDEDIAAHIALLAQRKDAMHGGWQADEDPDTEALRVALVNYRDLRNRLADVRNALMA